MKILATATIFREFLSERTDTSTSFHQENRPNSQCSVYQRIRKIACLNFLQGLGHNIFYPQNSLRHPAFIKSITLNTSVYERMNTKKNQLLFHENNRNNSVTIFMELTKLELHSLSSFTKKELLYSLKVGQFFTSMVLCIILAPWCQAIFKSILYGKCNIMYAECFYEYIIILL